MRPLLSNQLVIWRSSSRMIDDILDPELRCGLGNVRPNWLQVFANSKCYLIVHCLLAIFQVISVIRPGHK